MKHIRVGLMAGLLALAGFNIALAQQYSYGVYDYAYVDPNTGGVMDYGSDPTYNDVVDYYQGDGINLAEVTPVEKPILLSPNVIRAINENVGESINTNAVDEEQIKKDLLEEMNKKLEAEKNKKKTEEEPQRGFGAKIQGMFSEYWVQLLALVVSVIGVVLAVSGFSIANKSKQKNLKKFLHEIDDAYTSYKWKTKRCEAELYRLLDQVEEQLKEGKIDESTFSLLEKRIHKYLDEIKYAEERPMPSSEERKKNGEKLAKDIDEVVEGRN